MRYIISIMAIAAGLAILKAPQVMGESVSGAVNSCLEVIVPSLFAFTVLSVYLQRSGLYRVALKPVTLPLSRLMRIDEELCAVFVLGNIGGYPVGARLLSELVGKGRLSDADAGRLLCCCYGSGPSFVVSIVGVMVFANAAAGAVIFAACFLTSLALGVVVCRFGERISLAPERSEHDLSAECFVSSVMSAARVMYTVCAMIVGFSAVTAVLDIIGAAEMAERLFGTDAVFSALLEISCIRRLSPAGEYILPMCAALLSFGGVCVVLQVCALVGGRIPLRGFLLSRIPASALSAAIAALLAKVMPDAVRLSEQSLAVSATISASVQTFSVNAGMSFCLLMMCGILLLTERKNARDK